MTSRTKQAPTSRARRWFLTGFAVVYAAWLVVGVVDNLVWMPQLIAPTTPLDEIYAVLTRAGSAPGVAIAPILWLVFWAIAGAIYLTVLLPAHPRFQAVAGPTSWLIVVGSGLTLFGAMAFWQWGSGFGMGMEVSDELPPYVGNTTPFGQFCVYGGFLITLLGALTWIIGGLRAGGSRPAGTTAGQADAEGIS